MVENSSILQDIADHLAFVFLAKHSTAIQNEAVVYNIASFRIYCTPQGWRNYLR
jgi:hypothetical protein